MREFTGSKDQQGLLVKPLGEAGSFCKHAYKDVVWFLSVTQRTAARRKRFLTEKNVATKVGKKTALLKRRSHMTIGMTTGWQTGRHTDRRYRSHMTTGVQTGVPTDRRYVHT